MRPGRLHLLPAAAVHAWLLVFALCLPLAQWATWAHALQHLPQPASSSHEADSKPKPAQAPAACDICQAAVTLGSGAPLPALAAIAAISLPQAEPAVPPLAHHDAAPEAFYSSRAPPLLPV